MSVRPARVELRIEELVLHGVPPGDRLRVADAFERELSRIIAERGLPPGLDRPRAVGSLIAPDLSVQRGAAPRATGENLAGAVYESLAGAATHSAGRPKS
jgi:hypothetical protein